MVRIAIVEDEEKYFNVLEGYIQKYIDDNNDEINYAWFKTGVDFLEKYHSDFDIILMDIEMPGMNGISVAKDIRNVDTSVLIIFITNMAQYAIHGYEVDALDYVVKPIEYYPFSIKLRRAIRIIREQAGNSIMLPFPEEDRRIPTKDILYIEVHSHTVVYYTYYGESVATGTLRELEEKLKNDCFARCNSCYLVNLRHVTGIKDESVLIEGTKLKISRSKKKDFMNQLSKFYSEN